MSVAPLDVASVFLNSMCFLSAGIVCAYLAMSAFFRKRHSLWLFFGVIVLKATLVALFDTICWFNWDNEAIRLALWIAISILGVSMIPANYHTWETSLANVGFIGIITDLIAGIAMSVSMLLVNTASGQGSTLGYVGYMQVSTALMALLAVGLFTLFLQAVKPIGRYLVAHTFKYEKLILIIVVMSIVPTSALRFSGIEDSLLGGFAVPLLAAFSCAPVIAAYTLVRLRETKKQQAYLARSLALMSACDDAMRSQAQFLADSRDVLDDLATRIECIGNAPEREGLRRYLDDMRAVCDSLRFGTYSDNPLLDTVLQHYEESFDAAGVRIDYRVSPLVAQGERVALVAQELLNWAIRTVEPRDSSGCPQTVLFRAFRKANRLFVEVCVPQGDSYVPFRSWRAWKDRTICDVVYADVASGVATVRALVSEVQP